MRVTIKHSGKCICGTRDQGANADVQGVHENNIGDGDGSAAGECGDSFGDWWHISFGEDDS